MIKPIPCPNCGEVPEIKNLGNDCYYAMCSCVESAVNKDKYSFLGITPERAIKRWNDYFGSTNKKDK